MSGLKRRTRTTRGLMWLRLSPDPGGACWPVSGHNITMDSDIFSARHSHYRPVTGKAAGSCICSLTVSSALPWYSWPSQLVAGGPQEKCESESQTDLVTSDQPRILATTRPAGGAVRPQSDTSSSDTASSLSLPSGLLWVTRLSSLLRPR